MNSKIKWIVLIVGLVMQNKTLRAQTSLSKKLDQLFSQYADSGFAGSVLLAEKNKITFKKGYGFANNEQNLKNTPSTLFNIASVGKQFTAYSVLLLEKKGLLNTNDRVSKYFGSFHDARDSVTIHHLLLHSSGLFKEATILDYSTRDNFIQSVKKGELEARAGEKYRYSNAGYNALAAIVEIVTARSFEDFLFENVFVPCDMKNTGYPFEQRLSKNSFATGYSKDRVPMKPQENIWGVRGPGHLVTTMEDLSKWIIALQNPKFLPLDMKSKMFYDHIPGKETYSWNKGHTKHHTSFYFKGGGRPDFESQVMWYPDDEVMIIFSINNDIDLRRKLFAAIREIMN